MSAADKCVAALGPKFRLILLPKIQKRDEMCQSVGRTGQVWTDAAGQRASSRPKWMKNR